MDREGIRQKAIRMEEFLHDLEPILDLGEASFTHDAMAVDAGHRLLELLVADAVWINTELVGSVGGAEASGADSFAALQAIGGIDEPTARTLAACAAIPAPRKTAERARLFAALVASVPVWRAYGRQVVARV
ncbi:MAG: hypothetical protein FJW37_10210 [Acidobacteria bacterium]|nr:hypothetical protein [Acidobacteriota bacterium]